MNAMRKKVISIKKPFYREKKKLSCFGVVYMVLLYSDIIYPVSCFLVYICLYVRMCVRMYGTRKKLQQQGNTVCLIGHSCGRDGFKLFLDNILLRKKKTNIKIKAHGSNR